MPALDDRSSGNWLAGFAAVSAGQRQTAALAFGLLVAVLGFGLPDGPREQFGAPAEFTPSARAAVSAGLSPQAPPTTSAFLAPAVVPGVGPDSTTLFPEPVASAEPFAEPAPALEPSFESDPGGPTFESEPAPTSPPSPPEEEEQTPPSPSPVPLPVPIPVPLPL